MVVVNDLQEMHEHLTMFYNKHKTHLSNIETDNEFNDFIVEYRNIWINLDWDITCTYLPLLAYYEELVSSHNPSSLSQIKAFNNHISNCKLHYE